MTTCGVLYMAWGLNAIREVEGSVASLWQVAPDMPVFVVGDRMASNRFTNGKRIHGNLQFRYVAVSPFAADGKFHAGLVKPLLAGLSPFDKSLYIDADTAFRQPPDVGFEMLDKWDLLISESLMTSLAEQVASHGERIWTRQWIGTQHCIYHNSGMLFWRKNERTDRLFDVWSEEWQRWPVWDEQVAILRAMMRCEDLLYQNMPYTWNCLHSDDAYLLHHRYGTRVAWKNPTVGRLKGGKQRIRPSQGPIHIPMERQRVALGGGSLQSGSLINVEVSKDVFVQCKPGEERIAIERHRARLKDAAKRSRK
jgi:hypothetical protein